jgi:type II secretory pathway pseudopilin PulG
MRFPKTSSTNGFQLAELTIVLAIMAFMTMLGMPQLLRGSADLRLHLAADELVGVLRLARSWAVRHNANVAVKFRTAADGMVTFTLYRDGNANGVLTADINAGRDPQVEPPRRLSSFGRGVGFGFPPGPAPTDPGSPGHLLTPVDPIRFNSSDLASFSPLGTSTPGSLYLTDGLKRLLAVRLDNRAGRVRVLAYDAAKRVWHD